MSQSYPKGLKYRSKRLSLLDGLRLSQFEDFGKWLDKVNVSSSRGQGQHYAVLRGQCGSLSGHLGPGQRAWRGDFSVSGLCACGAGAWLVSARHGLLYCVVRGVEKKVVVIAVLRLHTRTQLKQGDDIRARGAQYVLQAFAKIS